MKLEKWTVALTALGVVSLASVAKAEEQASSVMTALASTTLSGYVDTSAQWNFGTGNANLPPYKFGGASKADGFNLNVIQLRIEKPLDEAEWAAGYRVDLWAGPDANVLATQSLFGNDINASTGDFAVRQAYAALRTPVVNGIEWKVGVFDSIIGYESVESPNDPNYTRSYGHSIEPQTHTGVVASYRFNDLLSASVGIANTIGPQINSRAQAGSSGVLGGPFASFWRAAYAGAGIDPASVQGFNAKAESYKTYMGSVAVTAPDSMGFLAGSTLYAGVVNGFNNSQLGSGVGGNQTSYYVGATVATPVTGLRMGAALDLLDVENFETTVGGATLEADLPLTWALAGYASFQATEKLSFHGRLEYFKSGLDVNLDGVDLPEARGRVMAATATAQYDLWRNVISRLEFRWDHSLTGDEIFGGSTTGDPDRKNAWMLGANIIYKF